MTKSHPNQIIASEYSGQEQALQNAAMTDEQTNRRTDEQTNRLTDEQTNR